ncbi:MAG: putative peptide maturation dehydrogenase, partial [Gammaproteobacteria bacterium]|nr:putative peptide maturation dehydrogenase [Gammaproteobacteria bacterium]
MRVRRCAVLFLEPREEATFDLDSLFAGGAGIRRASRWVAHAPHLPAEVEVDADARELLGMLSPQKWSDRGEVADSLQDALDVLMRTGLVLKEDVSTSNDKRDALVRSTHWWPLGAVFHSCGRWSGVDGVQAMEDADLLTASGLSARFGPPPLHVRESVAPPLQQRLTRDSPTAFDDLLSRRATCRNFDQSRVLPESLLAKMLMRVFGAQAEMRAGNEAVFLKKTSPSGGGLHATEAYLIVQNVEGVAPGLYHYHPVDHGLDPLPGPDVPLADFAKLALAGQHWFANAPVLVVLAPRFARSFWKYRHHAKAYRALILDSGHLSQTLYLSATDLGLGAFVTSAINEVDIEQAFGMDPLEESPLAICGFGWRAERMETAEFDPAGEVW